MRPCRCRESRRQSLPRRRFGPRSSARTGASGNLKQIIIRKISFSKPVDFCLGSAYPIMATCTTGPVISPLPIPTAIRCPRAAPKTANSSRHILLFSLCEEHARRRVFYPPLSRSFNSTVFRMREIFMNDAVGSDPIFWTQFSIYYQCQFGGAASVILKFCKRNWFLEVIIDAFCVFQIADKTAKSIADFLEAAVAEERVRLEQDLGRFCTKVAALVRRWSKNGNLKSC